MEEHGRWTYVRVVADDGQPSGRVLVRERKPEGAVHITLAGRRFFAENIVEIVPRLPVITFYRGRSKTTDFRLHPDANRYLPLDDAEFVDTYSQMGRVRVDGSGTDEAVMAKVRDEVQSFLDRRGVVAEVFHNAAQGGLRDYLDHKVVLEHYATVSLYDPTRPILYDERLTYIRNDGHWTSEVLLDRPLRQFLPYTPDWLDRVGLCPMALQTPKDKNCVLVQVAACLQRRYQKRSVDGRMVDGFRKLFEEQELADLFDIAWEECGYEVGSPPFEEGIRGQTWRELGVTLAMLKHVSEHGPTFFRIVVYVQGRYVWRHPPLYEERDLSHTPVVALTVHGFHAFVYEGERSRQLVERWRHVKSLNRSPIQLANPYKPRKEAEVNDIQRFNWYTFETHLAENKPTVFVSPRLEDLALGLRAAGINFFTSFGADAWAVASLTHWLPAAEGQKKQKKIVIRAVPNEWKVLQALCKVVSAETRFSITYMGESVSVLSLQLLNQLLHQEGRSDVSGIKQQLRAKQQNVCASCQSELTDDYRAVHLDHIQPLHENGADDEQNLRVLCAACHEEVTQQQEAANAPYQSLFGPTRGLLSQLSPQLYRLFHGPLAKPKQLSGRVDGAAEGEVYAYDIRGCRKNALEQCTRPLPCFCFTDEPKLLEQGYVEGFDYYILDDGRAWWCEAVELRLRFGIISPSCVRYGLMASGKLPVERYRAACDALRRCIELTESRFPDQWVFDNGQPFDEDLAKTAVLSAIGLMNMSQRVTWYETRTDCSADHVGVGRRRRRVANPQPGDPEWEILDSVEHKSLISWRPIGQIALCMETARVEVLAQIVVQNPQCCLHSFAVDAVNFTAHPSYQKHFAKGIAPDSFQYINGESVYKPAEKWSEKKFMKPTWPLAPGPSPEIEQPRQWTVVQDPSVDEFFKLIWRCKGAFLTGPAGTGKSYMLTGPGACIERLQAKGCKVITIAWTHFAAMVIGGAKGQTLTHFLLAYQKGLPDAANTWIVLDEVSQPPLKVFPLLAAFQFVGLGGCICVGDFQQMLPIAEAWGDEAFLRLEWCQGFCELVGGLRVELTQCRRSDRAHFDYYCGARSVKPSLTDLLAHFPWDPARHPIDVCICLKHSTREFFARVLNKDHAAKASGVVKVCPDPEQALAQGSSMACHASFLCWPGQLLIGCRRRQAVKAGEIVNGLVYRVVSVSSTHVSVRVDLDDADLPETRLTHHAAIQYLRLHCARTYASCQGATFKGRVLLLDVNHPYVDCRALYVGISRVTSGAWLHVPTSKQIKQLQQTQAVGL